MAGGYREKKTAGLQTRDRKRRHAVGAVELPLGADLEAHEVTGPDPFNLDHRDELHILSFERCKNV